MPSKLQVPSPEIKDKPAAAGYYMPAEWMPHESTWLSWPHNDITWPGKRMAVTRDIYLQMLEALLPYEKVNLLAGGMIEKVRAFLKPKLTAKAMNNLILHDVRTVDAWIRDYGPTFVVNSKKEKAWVKWIFNAWGGKYEDLMQDTKIFENHSLVQYPCFEAGIVLEGGSIEVNGAGTCMTSEQCLLNKNRNPKLSKRQIEQFLKDYLGVSQILWLNEGIVGDDTDGHIDDIARFTDENTILAAYEDDESDENHGILKENWERLKKAGNEKGKKWNLVKFPMPDKVADGNVRLPASYANFLISNGTVLLPVFECDTDDRAIKIARELFPKREIVPITCNTLVYGLGTIHCVSQQEPIVSKI